MNIDDFYANDMSLLYTAPRIKQKPKNYISYDPHLVKYTLADGTIYRNLRDEQVSPKTFISKPIPEYFYITEIDRHRSGSIVKIKQCFDDMKMHITYDRTGSMKSIHIGFQSHIGRTLSPTWLGPTNITPYHCNFYDEKFNDITNQTVAFFKSLDYDVSNPRFWFTVGNEHKLMYKFERQLWIS